METKEGSYSKGSVEEKIKAQELCKQLSRTIVNLLYFFKRKQFVKRTKPEWTEKIQNPERIHICVSTCLW